MRRISLRIGLLALIGAVVVCAWTILMMVSPAHQFGRMMVFEITVPVSLLRPTAAVSYHSMMLLNAAAYGLAGLAIEPLWTHRQPVTR